MSDAHAQLAQQIADLRAEGDDVYELLTSLESADFDAVTSFKNWTVRDVVAHLHLSDVLALKSVTDVSAFHQLSKDMAGAGMDMRGFAEDWLSDLDAPGLLQQWRDVFGTMCDAFAAADPSVKFEWFGPGMKARMFATARQMETWAHATELYDLFRRPREYSDRIRNVVEIGVRTFGWTYATRKQTPPGPPPRIELVAPSGALWTYNEDNTEELIKGDAVSFAQVVTQVRNVADTSLVVQGSTATSWMSIAQCFAGGPVEPPAPGTRAPSSN
ncbi:MAG: TIGR03084 family metal-binding protein [Pseudomonadaceae bacterium]|nr:TIGR03084 family metal-binding protein [Pseudomonadaceae bacterium]